MKILSMFLSACCLLITSVAWTEDADVPVSAMFDRLDRFIERHETGLLEGAFRSTVEALDAPCTPGDCADGVFHAVSPADDYGFFHAIAITIERGRITGVVYDEISVKQNIAKKSHPGYNQEMKETGTSPSEAYPIYEQALIESQDLNQLDAVTGATYSLYRMKTAAARALMTAREYKRTGETPVYNEIAH